MPQLKATVSHPPLSGLPDAHDRGGWLRRRTGTEDVRMSAMWTHRKTRSFRPKTPKINGTGLLRIAVAQTLSGLICRGTFERRSDWSASVSRERHTCECCALA